MTTHWEENFACEHDWSNYCVLDLPVCLAHCEWPPWHSSATLKDTDKNTFKLLQITDYTCREPNDFILLLSIHSVSFTPTPIQNSIKKGTFFKDNSKMDQGNTDEHLPTHLSCFSCAGRRCQRTVWMLQVAFSFSGALRELKTMKWSSSQRSKIWLNCECSWNE